MRRTTARGTMTARGTIAAFAAAVALAGCSSLGPPLQGARTGDKIVRATGETSFARIAEIAWGDSTMAGSAATLAGMSPDDVVPKGTVLVLPTRERLETRLREARRFARGPASDAHAATATPSPGRRSETSGIYERGVLAMKENRTDDALRDWETVWREDPDFPGVADRLKQEYLVRGLDAFARGDQEAAAGFWERALAVDPADPKALGYLEHLRGQQERSGSIVGPGGAR